MSPPTSSLLPRLHFGYLFLAASALLLAVATHAVLISALFPGLAHLGGKQGATDGHGPVITTIIAVLDALARDTHYKYLALFSVPVCAYFVIANWTGWQFFRNS